MGWVAAGLTALGVGQSIFNSIGQKNAADAQNEAEYQRYIRERSAAFASTAGSDQQNTLNYQWKVAETEAIRFQEKQAKADYEWRAGRLADAALINLDLNQQAIYDQYVTAEQLRATQDSMSYTNEMGILGEKFNYDMDNTAGRLQYDMASLGNQASYELGALSIEANDAARGYITAVKDNALQAQQAAMQANRQMESLIQNQVLDDQLNILQRDIQFAASLADRGAAKASAVGRGVGKGTAKSLQMNQAKALGRSYGELLIKQRQRKGSIATMNATLQGETAKGLARYALRSKEAMDGLASSEKKFKNEAQFRIDQYQNEGSYRIGQAGRDMNYTMDSYRREGAFRSSVFSDLTLPGYDLAARQGQRDLDSLFLNTQGRLDEARMPFRESIIFDPQKPLPGMYTSMAGPTYQAGPSTLGVIGGAVVAGVNGALSATYKKADGSLGFY